MHPRSSGSACTIPLALFAAVAVTACVQASGRTQPAYGAAVTASSAGEGIAIAATSSSQSSVEWRETALAPAEYAREAAANAEARLVDVLVADPVGLGSGGPPGTADPDDGPRWDVHFKQRKTTFPRLQPRQRYQLVVALGTGPAKPGALVAKPSPAITKELDRAIAEPTPDPVYLDLYLLLDSASFETGGGFDRVLIDLEAYKLWRANPASARTFGSAKVDVRTADVHTEDARAAILVWKDGVPVDEIALRVCVGTSGPRCENLERLPTGEQPDPIRPSGRTQQPTAALHVVEMRLGDGESRMVARFKERNHPAVMWELDLSGGELREHLRNMLSRAFAQSAEAESDDGLREDGWALFSLVFPWNSPSGAAPANPAEKAHATFADFVRRQREAAGRGDLATLYGRVVMADGLALELPLGLMAMKQEDRPLEPIGFFMKVESALPRESYDRIECPRRWRMLLPIPGKDYGDKGALRNAVEVTELHEGAPLLKKNPATFVAEWDFEKFRTWVQKPEPEEQIALLLLAHHATNLLWHEKGTPLAATTLKRRFGEGSVAILDGCGTMEPSASEVVRALNRNGVGAAIATATSVDGKMAGAYVKCLLEKVAAAPPEGAPLSALHFDALRCLREESGGDDSYGALALVFGLLGNGAVRLCPPENL